MTFATYDHKLVASADRYGTKILDRADVVWGTEAAHAVDIDIVNLDQQELDDDAPLCWLPSAPTPSSRPPIVVMKSVEDWESDNLGGWSQGFF